MYTLNCNGRLLMINNPIVMGIINVTPDSFYSGSRKSSVEAVIRAGEKMLKEGATILDVGGQSTRPGSIMITSEEEIQRVIPSIKEMVKQFPEAYISIDTFNADVAKAAVEAGACIVNDISAGAMDAEMLDIVAALRVPYIAMHMKGTPATMQQQSQYGNVTRDVLDFFIQKTEQCRLAGIHDIIVDVGFGFAKTIAHNFQLLKDLQVFHMLNKPILVGLSRKSTIYKTLGTSAEDALNGTTVLNTISLLNGASILRVHDVKEAMESIRLVQAYKN